MQKKSAIAFLLSTAVIFTAVLVMVFWPSQSTNPVARGKSPATPLTQELTPAQTLAQDLALADTRVQGYTLGQQAEVMGVQPVGMHFTAAAAACATADCHLVNIYNRNNNSLVSVVVNADSREVLDVLYQPDTMIGVNARLHQRAIEIIYADEQVPELLGRPISMEEIMPMDGSMNDTPCGSIHQCIGATFFAANNHDILWVMVDMTDEKVVGYQWTHNDPNSSEEAAPYVTPDGCPPGGNVSRGGWTLSYETTGTDGLRVYNAYYNGRLILNNSKLVQWHADYGSSGYQDSTGCGGPGGGFPIYPYGDTVVNDISDGGNVIGFEVVQDFRMGSWGASCNYRYEQHVQFYNDGRFRVSSLAYGKGCGTNSMYRPIVRIDLAVDGDNNDQFALWDGSTWAEQNTEFYRTSYAGTNGPYSYDAAGAVARVYDTVSGLGYLVVPDQGQYGTNSRGDEPFIYVTQHKANEGDTDMGVFGQCCLNDHQQGPHLFVNGEAINNQNIVLWYVPQMLTDVTVGNYYCWTVSTSNTYPCWGGPMFVPYTANVYPTQATSYTGYHANGGTTSLSLPTGSVNVTTTLVYTAMQNVSTVPSGWLFTNHAFALSAYQNGVLMPSFVFNQPMNVTIQYPDTGVGGINEETLTLMYWNGSAWVDAATTCNPTSTYSRDLANNILSVNVCHLTEFALFGQPPLSNLYLPVLESE